ncbi:MAG: sugar phosphate nucleotidyltransferase [Candidatus Berkiella sp.]
MIAIVLVGGKHNIISETNPDTPLGLLPIAGEPVVSWITKWLKQQGFKHIIFSAGFGADKITAWASQISSQQNDFFVDVVAESRPLGTAGAAAFCVRRYPSSTILVANGDSLLLTNLKPSLSKLHNNPNLDGIIMGAKVANAGRYGSLECDSENRLIGFHEKKSGTDVVNAGVYLLRSHLLEDLNADKEISLEYDCFPTWLNAGKEIHVARCSDPFIDMGSTEALKNAEEQILRYQALITDDAVESSL